jgi:pimeloyl-ACP methyl ester carboxylesterase
MKTVIFIHGLNSSYLSFSYLVKELGAGNYTASYKSRQSLNLSIEEILLQIPKKEAVVLVGHSLGGIIAMNIAHMKIRNITKVITISSPLSGSKAAIFAQWLLRDVHVLKDIVPSSHYIKSLAQLSSPCPVLSIYSTGGSLPAPLEANDSIVTVSSQKSLLYARHAEVKANHFEVLLHPDTTTLIRDFIAE